MSTATDHGLTAVGRLGILRWEDSEMTHMNLGIWSTDSTLFDGARDSMRGCVIPVESIYSFTPCTLVETEALDRLRDDAPGSLALGAFFEHVEVMNP